MTSIEQAIADFIAAQILHDSSSITLGRDQALLEEGILDSLGLQQLVAFLESEYSLDITDDYLMPEHFESIAAIASLVEEIRGQPGNLAGPSERRAEQHPLGVDSERKS
jgi:acyl carrier protein